MWDILVFKDPQKPDLWVTKRLIGLPREQVEVEDAQVRIDGRSYRLANWGSGSGKSKSRSVKLEKDEIFIPCSGTLKHVSKIILLKQIRLHPAVFAGKQSVRFF